MTATILQPRQKYPYLHRKKLLTVEPFSTVTAGKRDVADVNIASRLRPWRVPVVTCNGDYREEAWLEGHVGGPLYEHQSELPKLPVCRIDDTVKKFLPTAVPLAKSESERAALLRAAEQFPRQAAELQRRLEDRAREYKDSSWLQHWVRVERSWHSILCSFLVFS